MNRLLITIMLLTSTLIGCANSDSIDQVARSIVKIAYQVPEGAHICTGFVVSASRGWALTATHCVPENPNQDFFVDGDKSSVVKKDAELAIVTVTKMERPPLEVRKGAPLFGGLALSFGFGENQFCVMTRHISRVTEHGYLGLDGPLLQGMSGGPVLDEAGKVIGVNQGVIFDFVGWVTGQDHIREFIK